MEELYEEMVSRLRTWFFGWVDIHEDGNQLTWCYCRNRGELAEGWYDPATLEKARTNLAQMQAQTSTNTGYRGESQQDERGDETRHRDVEGEEDEDDDEYGPVLPSTSGRGGGPSSGPTIPTLQDLELRKGMSLFIFTETLLSTRWW